MKPEQYFLKYSFPCAHVLVEHGSITEEKLEEIRQNVIYDKIMKRDELEFLFPAAFRRIRDVAVKMYKDVWSMEVLKKYFLEEHNHYIEQQEGNYASFGKTFREFCKVNIGKVTAKEADILTVRYGDKERIVLTEILPDVKIGDKVSIHQGFAVEKFE